MYYHRAAELYHKDAYSSVVSDIIATNSYFVNFKGASKLN